MNSNLQQIFPHLARDEANARLEGVIPMTDDEIAAAVATPTFKALGAGQRSALVALWRHHLKPGSNQHSQRVDTSTPRAAAEAAATALRKAAQ